MTDWLTQQAPAIVVLCIAVYVLWKTLVKKQQELDDTTAWRSQVKQRLDDIDASLTTQANRITQLERLVGLIAVRSERANKN